MAANIEDIRQKFAENQFEFSKHAVDHSIVRRILVREVREAIAGGQVIEDYPDDKYGPSCLILRIHASTATYSYSVQLPLTSNC